MAAVGETQPALVERGEPAPQALVRHRWQREPQFHFHAILVEAQRTGGPQPRRQGPQPRVLVRGFVVRGPEGTAYQTGDTALVDGFAEIAVRCGPIDWAMLPIGA